jgi:hypothetical protein
MVQARGNRFMLFVDTYVYRRLPLLRALSRWLLQANCPSAWTSPARDMIETYDGYVVAEETALDDTVALLQDSVPAALRQRGVAIAETGPC